MLSVGNRLAEWFDVRLLKENPAKRLNIRRLTLENKNTFFELLRTPEKNRTPQQLKNAGIVRPDWSYEDFMSYWYVVADDHKEYYLSNEFLQKWLTKGYISFRDIGHSKDCVNIDKCSVCDDRLFVNMCCGVVDEGDCCLENCYLPYAKFDNTHFYKATIDNCILDGATAYNAYFDKCNDGNLFFVKHLEKLGVVGIDSNLYK